MSRKTGIREFKLDKYSPNHHCEHVCGMWLGKLLIDLFKVDKSMKISVLVISSLHHKSSQHTLHACDSIILKTDKVQLNLPMATLPIL